MTTTRECNGPRSSSRCCSSWTSTRLRKSSFTSFVVTGGEKSNAVYVLSLAGEVQATVDNFQAPPTVSTLSPDDEMLVLGTQTGQLYFYENYIKML